MNSSYFDYFTPHFTVHHPRPISSSLLKQLDSALAPDILAAMKILAGILISLYLGLTLFGLYQYKAHNRSWGMKLVVWMSGVVLFIGVGVRFGGWILLAAYFGAGFCLAYFIGWRVVGGHFTGWRRHLVRAVAFALWLGPTAAMRCSELYNLVDWLGPILDMDISFMDILRFFFYGLPGFFLVGGISFLVSAGCEIWKKRRQEGPAITMNRRVKLGYGLLLLAMLLCVNWYIAGVFNVYECVKAGKKRILTYVRWSRPGSLSAWDSDGWTPLHNAAMGDQTEAVKWLIKAGAKINAKDGPGGSYTPLHGAVVYGHTEAVKLLIKAGAEVNVKMELGYTPLHWAAGDGNTEAVKLLLEAAADINAKEWTGRTPLDLAKDFGKYECAELLLKHGAKTGAELDAEAKQVKQE